jgi:hypothetical protein
VDGRWTVDRTRHTPVQLYGRTRTTVRCASLPSISCRYRASSASVSTTSFFFAFSCTFLVRCTNSSVLVDSATALASGLSVQITEMCASPESEGCSMRVNLELELRNMTWSLHPMSVQPWAKLVNFTYFFPADAFSASVAIMLPRLSKLKTITLSNQHGRARVVVHLVLMNLRVRSLSEVASSELAKSIKLNTLDYTLILAILVRQMLVVGRVSLGSAVLRSRRRVLDFRLLLGARCGCDCPDRSNPCSPGPFVAQPTHVQSLRARPQGSS